MENAPSIPLATPTSPGNALIGIRIPFTSSNHANFFFLFIFHILSAGSGYSSARSPKAGDETRPAPVCSFNFQNFDLQSIPRFGFGDVHWSADLVELRKHKRR